MRSLSEADSARRLHDVAGRRLGGVGRIPREPGDLVLGSSGWQEYALSDGSGLTRLDARMSRPSTALGVLGMPGFTAYMGLLDIGQPKAGETEKLLESRVVDLTAGFRDRIALWDVVNEPVNVRTWQHKMENFRSPIDWDVVEPVPLVADYVERALRWARRGNPRGRASGWGARSPQGTAGRGTPLLAGDRRVGC